MPDDLNIVWWQWLFNQINWRAAFAILLTVSGGGFIADGVVDANEDRSNRQDLRKERLYQLEVEHELLLDLYATEAALDSCLAAEED